MCQFCAGRSLTSCGPLRTRADNKGDPEMPGTPPS
jgi:hypothetical protein